jgi:hypothetical protein
MAKWLLFLLPCFLFATSCRKPLNPTGALSDPGKYLVIDGVVNAGSDSTFIRLSRTKKFDTVVVVNHEQGAVVTVESSAGQSYPLNEIRPGTYAAPPLNLSSTNTYRVRIKTANGEQYLSDFVVVKNSPPIDSLGFTANSSSVNVYANTHDDANNTRYYRWEYTEAWRFHSTYESFYDVTEPRVFFIYYCYAADTSSFINLATSIKLTKDVIYQGTVVSIPSSSEKVQMRYSIQVTQYALTADAYSFWDNLRKNTEANGTIFDAQPSLNQTNYHCLTNPAELVVGWLSVGSTATRRIFIDRSQLPAAYNPQYALAGGCHIDTAHYNDGSFSILGDTTEYTAINGYYHSPFPPMGPNDITYSTRDCADCTSRGKTVAPPFWKP